MKSTPDVTDDCTLLDRVRRRISDETVKVFNIDGGGWDVVACCYT